jgi:adenylate cyclase
LIRLAELTDPRHSLTGERVERRLAVVLAADIAGFSRLSGLDEEGVLARLRALRAEVVNPEVVAHDGRVFKNTGDGFLAEFRSVVSATRCALEIQRTSESRNADLPSDRRLDFRIGIHLGDVIAETDGDLMGDGVNVAARIEGAAAVGGISLSRAAHEQVRDRLDVAFTDRGEVPLKNIARPVHIFDVANLGVAPARAAEAPKALALPDKPSIAVLPFQNMSGDPEQEYFADGLVEDIITALSRYKSLFVIARNSSFTYKGKVVDIKQVGRELGVSYVLEGSVRKAGSRLRITGQLIEAATGAHLWAEKIDGQLEDVFELQDLVASSVAGVIDPVLQEAETRRAFARPTSDLTSYDLYLRATQLRGEWSRESIAQAIVLLRQAIERDPNYGIALASMAFCHSQNIWCGWSENVEAEVEQCRSLARRALAAAPADPEVIGWAAGALMNLGDDINILKGLADDALVRNPSSARGWFWSGWMRTFAGENNLAIEHFEKSLRLDPRATRRAFHMTGMGICHLQERRFDRAVSDLEASFHELPTYLTTKWSLAACYAQMGRLDEAREFAARNDIVPGGKWGQLRSRFAVGDSNRCEYLLAGLRMATGEQP